uniref:Uncharacterized protein n=1 Tax=Cacopsylla melanoneura TaxID=428564 RepID=A0A8D8ZBZ4_9HEMI
MVTPLLLSSSFQSPLLSNKPFKHTLNTTCTNIFVTRLSNSTSRTLCLHIATSTSSCRDCHPGWGTFSPLRARFATTFKRLFKNRLLSLLKRRRRMGTRPGLRTNSRQPL